MNIFALHSDPGAAAIYLCDGHVIKMTLESAQILSTVARRLELSTEPSLYRPTHERHPCVQWAAMSPANYEWLTHHFFYLCEQYERRYDRKHKCLQLFPHFQLASAKFYSIAGRPLRPSPFALAMPEYCKIQFPPGRGEGLGTAAAVWSYRNYYWNEKFTNPRLCTYFRLEYPCRARAGAGWVEQFIRYARQVRVAETRAVTRSFSNESLQVTTRDAMLVTSENLEAIARVVSV